MYLEFLLRRAHSRRRVERRYWSGVSLYSFTTCSNSVTVGTIGPIGSGLPQFGFPRRLAMTFPVSDLSAYAVKYDSTDLRKDSETLHLCTEIKPEEKHPGTYSTDITSQMEALILRQSSPKSMANQALRRQVLEKL